MADRWDIGGVSTALAADTGLPTVFVYDGYPGGVGIAERGYDQAREHQQATLEVIRGCRCESGCPSCVHSPKCGNGNDPLDKHGATRLLGEILR
jgi:DEAD/DEAH box helicase domain-containing protein